MQEVVEVVARVEGIHITIYDDIHSNFVDIVSTITLLILISSLSSLNTIHSLPLAITCLPSLLLVSLTSL